MMRYDISFSLKKPPQLENLDPAEKDYQIHDILENVVFMVNYILVENGFRKVEYSIIHGFGYRANKDRQRTKYGFAKPGLPFVPDFFVSDVEPGRSDTEDWDDWDDNFDFTTYQLLFYQNIFFESSTIPLIDGLDIEFLRPAHSNQGSSLILKTCLENANTHPKPSGPQKVHIAGVFNLPENTHAIQSDKSDPNKRLSECSESPRFDHSMNPIRIHIPHSSLSIDIMHGDQAEESDVPSNIKNTDNAYNYDASSGTKCYEDMTMWEVSLIWKECRILNRL
ncbi:unnamed protein product [Ambrosiozyma monospora]|uniref:Unnamed protein product n=1 Tax=Ambrosiozyma monospora TaxID=43982 RepID=A0ACB5SV94_AMBMO|nr:unnamed protein product [Ambrosiozyma monospora]